VLSICCRFWIRDRACAGHIRSLDQSARGPLAANSRITAYRDSHRTLTCNAQTVQVAKPPFTKGYMRVPIVFIIGSQLSRRFPLNGRSGPYP
jgi:hypothetical protein